MSGDKDKDITSPVCPMKDVHCWPVSMSHRALVGKETAAHCDVTRIYILFIHRRYSYQQGAEHHEESGDRMGTWGALLLYIHIRLRYRVYRVPEPKGIILTAFGFYWKVIGYRTAAEPPLSERSGNRNRDVTFLITIVLA